MTIDVLELMTLFLQMGLMGNMDEDDDDIDLEAELARLNAEDDVPRSKKAGGKAKGIVNYRL